jgi:polysaccharide biosynthesis/export protein
LPKSTVRLIEIYLGLDAGLMNFFLRNQALSRIWMGQVHWACLALLLAEPAVAAGSFPPPSAMPPVPLAPNLAPNSGIEGDSYILGGGDRIRLDFFSVPEFSGEYQILPNGSVNLPRVGPVGLQGRTLKQASEMIALKFSPYLARPVITVSLLFSRPMTITIGGEVNRPGSYTVPSESGSQTFTTVSRSLALTEGVTLAANLHQVKVRRRRPYGLPGQAVYTLDLWRVEAGDPNQDIRLQDGDSIVIPASTTIDLAETRRLTTLSFATRTNRPAKIAVVGEVNRPGPYTITDGQSPNAEQRNATQNSAVPSVTQAIQTAGGITPLADIRNIQVKRLTRSGDILTRNVDFLQLVKAGDVLQDLPLQDGDQIEIATAKTLSEQDISYIPKTSIAPDRITVNIVGRVERPGPVVIPPSTPLNQALLAAGGFNQTAKKSSVTLIRLNPNGSVSKRDISVNLAQGVNEENNPALRSNDTIIVKRSGFAAVTETFGSIASPITGAFSLFRLLGF